MGLEGDKKDRRISATCKHFAGYDMEDWNGHSRHSFDAQITPQDLAEYYLRTFQECARDSKAGSSCVRTTLSTEFLRAQASISYRPFCVGTRNGPIATTTS
jgi:beta-glucosidase-like glycosyl hydrolase